MYDSLHHIIETNRVSTLSKDDQKRRSKKLDSTIFNEQYLIDLNQQSNNFGNRIKTAKIDLETSSIQLDDLNEEIDECLENIENDLKRNEIEKQKNILFPCFKQIFIDFLSIDIKLFGGNVIYNDVIDVFDTELEFILGEIDEQENFLQLIRQDIDDYYI